MLLMAAAAAAAASFMYSQMNYDQRNGQPTGYPKKKATVSVELF